MRIKVNNKGVFSIMVRLRKQDETFEIRSFILNPLIIPVNEMCINRFTITLLSHDELTRPLHPIT